MYVFRLTCAIIFSTFSRDPLGIPSLLPSDSPDHSILKCSRETSSTKKPSLTILAHDDLCFPGISQNISLNTDPFKIPLHEKDCTVKQAWEALHAVSSFGENSLSRPIKNSERFLCKQKKFTLCFTNLFPHGALSLFVGHLLTYVRTVSKVSLGKHYFIFNSY